MSKKNAVLRIKILDSKKQPLTPGNNDSVEVDGATLPYAKDKSCFEHALEDGDIKLDVRYGGYAVLSQWFEVKAPAEQPRCAPYWPGTDSDPDDTTNRREYLLECMGLTSIQGQGEVVYTLSIVLYPTREYVALIGTDYYHEGIEYNGTYKARPSVHKSSLPFRDCAKTYAQHLFASGITNASSPFTLVDCERGDVTTWLRARKGTGSTKVEYRLQSSSLKRKPAKWSNVTDYIKFLNSGRKKSDYITADDAHAYLDEVGGTRPGTVQNFSVFSHAWAGGPILFNTVTEDPLDFDPRKEALAAVTGDYPSLAAAFNAGSSESHFWGCFATTLYKAMVLFIRDTTASSKSKFSDPQNGLVGLPASATRAEVLTFLNLVIDEESYMSRFASLTWCDTYGGPPGWGSDLSTYNKVGGVTSSLKAQVSGSIMTINLAQNKAEPVFKRQELGSRTFDVFKYMRYTPA